MKNKSVFYKAFRTQTLYIITEKVHAHFKKVNDNFIQGNLLNTVLHQCIYKSCETVLLSSSILGFVSFLTMIFCKRKTLKTEKRSDRVPDPAEYLGF